MTKSTITREQAEEAMDGLEGLISRGIQSVYLDIAIAGLRQLVSAMDQKPALHRYRRKAVEPYGPYPWHYEVFVDYPRPVEGIEDEYFYAAPPVVTGFAVDGYPTDDERIMAIEGIHNCERCGDEGWVIGEMGITRCACGQADNSSVIPEAEQRIAGAVELLKKAAPAMLADNSGPDGPLAGRMKSPAIPDGYVLVPKEATKEILDEFDSIIDYGAEDSVDAWHRLLAAATQEVKP